jgi:NAD(P)H-hydrate epimerase
MTATALPIVTGQQMAAVDTAMADVCGLDLMQVMEVAGRAVAIVARQWWRRSAAEGTVTILCGSGGNGGDGFVCGRYLFGWGIPVELWPVCASDGMRGLAAHQLAICHKIGMTVLEPDRAPRLDQADLIVDGLFGFGLSAAPKGRAAELIDAANASSVPVLAIDLPSGIDATTGDALGSAIRADSTITLGLPKQGLVRGPGVRHAGVVVVADIGIPAAAYRAVGIPLVTAFQTAIFADLAGNPVWPDVV